MVQPLRRTRELHDLLCQSGACRAHCTVFGAIVVGSWCLLVRMLLSQHPLLQAPRL